MLFAVICTDKEGHGQVRKSVRPDHLDFLKGLGDQVKLAGPFTTSTGEPNGSLIVLEAASLEDARGIVSRDPYARAELFASVEIRPWSWTFNNPQG